MSAHPSPPPGRPTKLLPPAGYRAKVNLAEWAAWDADGRTPSWAELKQSGELHAFTAELAETPADVVRAEVARQERQQRLSDRTLVTHGQLRRLRAAMRRRLVAEVTEALVAVRRGQP